MNDPLVDTYIVSGSWTFMDNHERLQRIRAVLEKSRFPYDVDVVAAPDNGQLVLRVEQQISPSIRGLLLLQLETYLKEEVDEGLTVWLEPVGDKSKLRKLRGVVVKNLSDDL